jgi:hypothetical protein
VWPVAFTGAARWAGPVCRGGKVIRFHTNWGKFRPFPIDMAGFAINIKKLIIEYPRTKFQAMKRPGLVESSLLKKITAKEELEPIADCQKVIKQSDMTKCWSSTTGVQHRILNAPTLLKPKMLKRFSQGFMRCKPWMIMHAAIFYIITLRIHILITFIDSFLSI